MEEPNMSGAIKAKKEGASGTNSHSLTEFIRVANGTVPLELEMKYLCTVKVRSMKGKLSY